MQTNHFRMQENKDQFRWFTFDLLDQKKIFKYQNGKKKSFLINKVINWLCVCTKSGTFLRRHHCNDKFNSWFHKKKFFDLYLNALGMHTCYSVWCENGLFCCQRNDHMRILFIKF